MWNNFYKMQFYIVTVFTNVRKKNIICSISANKSIDVVFYKIHKFILNYDLCAVEKYVAFLCYP